MEKQGATVPSVLHHLSSARWHCESSKVRNSFVRNKAYRGSSPLAEIDKTLKSVGQGVELFESTFEKLGHASNSTQKDKLENDLKTQIKKLQRMRDQIKAWLGSSDIKDKTALLDNRKLIETVSDTFPHYRHMLVPGIAQLTTMLANGAL